MPPRRLQILPLAYGVAVACLFALAAWQRFSLPLDPIADNDTWGYLSPALSKLTGGNFVHVEGRNFLYPGFVFLVLRLFGDFRAITIIQHALGLAAGGLLLMTWRRAGVFVEARRLNAGIYHALGLAAGAIFLFAGEPICAEMQIRPEGVCAFLLGLNLWFAVEFIAAAFVEKRPPARGFGIGIAVSAVLLASVKPSFIFLALWSLLPVGIWFLRPGSFGRKIWVAGGMAAAAIVLLLPEYFLGRDDDIGRAFLPTTLFVVHADLIRDQMADDLKLGGNPPYPREWLSRVHDELGVEITKAAAAEPGHYLSLGFSPDYLMYQETSIARRLGEEFHDDGAAVAAFQRFYYWRTWRQRPLQMLKKIARQFAVFYAPICPAYDFRKVVPLTVWYRLGISSLHRSSYPAVWSAYSPAVAFMRRTELLAEQAPPIEQRKIPRRSLIFLAASYLPLLASTLALGAASLFWRDYRRRVGWLVALAFFVFAYNAAACLEVAILNSLEVPRYSTVQVYFTILAEFLAVWVLLETLLSRWRFGSARSSTHSGQ